MFSRIFRFFRDMTNSRNEWLRKTNNIPCDANSFNPQERTQHNNI